MQKQDNNLTKTCFIYIYFFSISIMRCEYNVCVKIDVVDVVDVVE